MSRATLARGLRWTLGIVLALLVLAVVLVWFALSSEWAARKLLATAVDRTPALERVGRVTGALGGPLELRDVIVRTEAMSARVDRVLLDWRPVALLGRRLELRRLHVSGVRVLLADSVPEEPDTLAEPRQRIDPPVEILLGDVWVRRVNVDAPGGIRLRGGALTLEGRARDYALEVSGDVATPAVSRVGLQARARGNLDGLELKGATAALLGGSVTTEGTVRWWPEIGWDVAIVGRELRPAPLMPDSTAWPGALSFQAASAGVLDSTGPVADVVLDTLTGSLRGEPLGGELTASARGEEYVIPSLALRWGSARLDASGRAGKDLDLRFDLAVPRLAALLPDAAGSLEVRGTATGPRDSARIGAAFSGRGLRFQANRLGRLSGRADLGLAPDGRTDLDLRGSAAVVAERRIDRLELTVRGTRERHRIAAEADAPDAALRLAAAGGLGADSVWTGRIGTVNLRSEAAGEWRLAGPVRLSAGAAAAELDTLCLRSADRARVCAAGAWQQTGSWRFASELEDVPLSLAAAFLPEGWSIEGSLGGRAKASASESGRLSADVHLVPEGVALEYVSDSVTRRLAVDGASLELEAGRRGVSGKLGAELQGEGGTRIGLITADFSLPDYTRVGQPLERQRVEARIESTVGDLSALRPFVDSVQALSGSARLDLTAAGTVRSPRLAGSMRLSELSVRHEAGWAARGSAEVGLDFTAGADRSLAGEIEFHPRDVVLELPGDTLPRRVALDTGTVEVRAGREGVTGRLLLALTVAGGRPLASAEGTFGLPEYTTLGQELGAQPVRLRLEGSVPDLGAFQEFAPPSSLTSLGGNAAVDLEVTGTLAAPSVTAGVQLRDARASHARGWSAAGALAATLDAALARDSTITGELHIVPGPTTFEYSGDEGQRRLTVDTGAVHLRAGAEGVQGTLAFRVSDQDGATIGRLSGTLELPGYTRLGQPPEGQVLVAEAEGSVDDLSFVEAVTDRVDSLAGRLALEVAARGTLAEPEVTGGVTFRDGAATLPAAGIHLRDLTFEAKGDQSGVITLTGGMTSGEGRLSVEGSVPVEPTTERPARVSIRGQDFEAVDLPEARVVISPTLDVIVTGEQIETEGEIRIPLARIELAETPVTAVPVSDDIVFVDSAAPAPGLGVGAEVRVVLGDSVSFKGFNFIADLGGSLLVVQPADGQPTGSGELVIEQGRYKAYGQDLSISQGQVRFAGGPVDNPALDIRATRTAEDGVVAGLEIGGTLKAPEVTIFSEPPMAQSEALAYIVLGHALGEGGSSEDGTLVAQAAQSLGLRGGNLLVRTLGRQVGLDEAKLETEGDLEEASFVAGKYLSPKLYVSYGIGLFDPVSTLRLRYVLSSNWTLQAETGTATGTDLLYRIEVGD